MPIVTLVAGLILLALGGDLLVRGAVGAATRLSIPPIIIGLTVVALGTSLPELLISLEAALRGAPGLAMGNVVGSNITNILAVLALPALIVPVAFTEGGTIRSAVIMLAVSALLVLLTLDGRLDRLDGMFLVLLLVTYLAYNVAAARRSRRLSLQEPGLEVRPEGLPAVRRIVVYVVLGAIGLALGGNLTTDGALELAATLGVADSAVGLTIVALGTSLPELAAGIAAAARRHDGVAVGNVLGSNILNILAILGITATIAPLDPPASILGFDIWIMLALSVGLVAMVMFRRRLGRIEAALMSLAYVAYLYVTLSGTTA